MSGWEELSFTDASGDNLQAIAIDQKFHRPVWSGDGKYLFGLSGGPAAYAGYPAYWNQKTGKFKVCNWNLPNFHQIQGADNVESPYNAIVSDAWEIYIYDISKCKYSEILVDYSDSPGKYSIAGFSYLATTQELVYGLVVNPDDNREYQLLKLDIKTGKQVELAAGINPTWSPDGNQIAFLGLDGMYIIDKDGFKIKQVVKYPIFNAWGSGSSWSMTPKPQWSPDNQWIIYHRCNKTSICMMGEAQMYKIHLSDGIEEELINSGEYPSWRPTLQE